MDQEYVYLEKGEYWCHLCDSIHHELGPFCFDNERLVYGTQYFSDDILPNSHVAILEVDAQNVNPSESDAEEIAMQVHIFY
ncbi:hypothetical protein DAPPUDRAFT_329245 [Daphnia pulex]|uniref:Uncharacterized protein n=1 Tax=Daphnia pulex TaxID=6669 RepID=E9HG22_DAPPU|nr:hypothetical protein DAPPUDRAFT_329245 [Daphnia pulex]|eukprot:EFX69333.1 hypothetical protein DAPPUDRAFT_329245 [Daphnia pulex]